MSPTDDRMRPFIHLVADYGASDPAFSEVVHRLSREDPDLRVQTTAVTPLSTVATGFWIAQLGLHNPPFDGLLIYSNTAPRTDDATPDDTTLGGALRYVRLDTGVPVVAVDAGYNLSFVRNRIEELRDVDVGEGDSQFRSRDFFPQRVAEIATGDMHAVGPERDVANVPQKPASVVCHVDGYGNVKTSIRTSEFRADRDELAVTINDRHATVIPTDSVTAIPEGDIGIVPGSAGGTDPFMELFLRGGSAAATFGDPEPGDTVEFE